LVDVFVNWTDNSHINQQRLNMITLSYKSGAGYWLVKNDAGDTLFASLGRVAAEDYMLLLELDASVSYHNWLAEQDAKFLENV
jgi:hypothetical protein